MTKEKKEKSRAQIQKESNAQEIKDNGFLNPLSKGVTYDDFLSEKKDKSVKDYCKNRLSKSELQWIEKELNNYKTNK